MKLVNQNWRKIRGRRMPFRLLAAPAAVFAGHHPPPPWYGPPPPSHARMPEPSSLVMTLVGMGFGVGLAVVGIAPQTSRGVTA